MSESLDYLTQLPRSRHDIPAGKVLVHNHVNPSPRLGSRGFRAWTASPDTRMVLCECGLAPELGAHYYYRRLERAPLKKRGRVSGR